MTDFAELFGVSTEQAKLELNKTLEFEIKLLKVTEFLKIKSHFLSLKFFQIFTEDEKGFNMTNFKELQAMYPKFTWEEFFNEMLSNHERVEMSDEIFIRSPLYLQSFINFTSHTPKRVLANYLMWNVALESTDYLSKRVQNVTKNFIVRPIFCFFIESTFDSC